MSPMRTHRTGRLVLARETVRTLAGRPSAAPAGFVITSCGQECGCNATIDQNQDIQKTF